jgi:hypothetical protein
MIVSLEEKPKGWMTNQLMKDSGMEQKAWSNSEETGDAGHGCV